MCDCDGSGLVPYDCSWELGEDLSNVSRVLTDEPDGGPGWSSCSVVGEYCPAGEAWRDAFNEIRWGETCG